MQTIKEMWEPRKWGISNVTPEQYEELGRLRDFLNTDPPKNKRRLQAYLRASWIGSHVLYGGSDYDEPPYCEWLDKLYPPAKWVKPRK